MQLIDILTINAVNWPDHVAIVAGEQRTTFAQLEHASFKLANMLARPRCRAIASPSSPGTHRSTSTPCRAHQQRG